METTSRRSIDPAPLEQLGAVGSLLIHEVANHMCVITGNASLAQMLRDDPAQSTRALEAVVKASERLTHMLGRCAELRRRLVEGLERGDATEAVAAVRESVAQRPGWECLQSGTPSGALMVPTQWVPFAVNRVLDQIGVNGGRLSIGRANPAEDTAFFPPGGAYLQFLFTWEGGRVFSMDEVRQQYEDFGLMAAFELLRQCGGRLDGYPGAPGTQKAIVLVPFAA